MSCLDLCCPPHNFDADRDPTVNDCNESVVPGYAGGYCPGSYWYNKLTGVLWIGANDMPCGGASWVNLNPEPRYHLQMGLSTIQQFASLIVPAHNYTIVGNRVQYDVVNHEEPAAAWDNGNHQLVAPADGLYAVSASIALESALLSSPVHQTVNGVGFINTEFDLSVVVNGVRVRRFAHYSTNQAYASQVPILNGSTTVRLVEGQAMYINLVHTMDDYISTNSVFDVWARGFLTIDQLV